VTTDRGREFNSQSSDYKADALSSRSITSAIHSQPYVLGQNARTFKFKLKDKLFNSDYNQLLSFYVKIWKKWILNIFV